MARERTEEDSVVGNDPAEGPVPKGYPSSIVFIIGNEFCERFSFYGMKAILPLYLVSWATFSEDQATTIIHTFNFSAYFFSLFGGILSDNYLGKFRTILYLSLVYCLGNVVMALTSLPGVTGDPPHWWGLAVGLVLIGLGTGGIKPCVASFGGDQFDPRQVRQLSVFFAVFYFSINAGSLLSMFLTPLLRKNVHCFGQDHCYPLAFGVPAALMLVATFVFWAGSRLYKKEPANDYVMLNFFRYTLHKLSHAVRRRLSISYWWTRLPDKKKWPANGRRGPHVLAGGGEVLYAPIPPSGEGLGGLSAGGISYGSASRGASSSESGSAPDDGEGDSVGSSGSVCMLAQKGYTAEFVADCERLLSVLRVFAPITLFWALYDQQGSRWVYQAMMMRNTISILGWPVTILPEQMGLANAFLILALIPLFSHGVYPWLRRLGFRPQPLARITCGLVLIAVSFLMAGVLQFVITSRGTFDEASGVCTAGCVNILWQLPQYVVITMAEVFVSITGLEFAYAEAPPGMKSVCQASWLLTVAGGNFIVIVFTMVDVVGRFASKTHVMAWNFLFWAGLMALGTVVFFIGAARYKYSAPRPIGEGSLISID